MIAKVIVDVPAKGTNRPFDYRVPEQLRSLVGIGSRVGVPFGPRTVQGFIVELMEDELLQDPAITHKLKELTHVLDVEPPLTEELVRLAGWMSRIYQCHEITALQAMIPGALKAKAERRISLGPEGAELIKGNRLDLLLPPEDQALLEYVGAKESVPLESLLERFPGSGQLLKLALSRGWLTESQLLKDRMKVKSVLAVRTLLEPEELREAAAGLPKSARRQKDVLEHLAGVRVMPIRLAELTQQLEVGAGTIKSLADKGYLELVEVEVSRDPYADRGFARTSPLPLTPEQQHVYGPIKQAVLDGRFEMFLLHGVTGSGKTEVYLQSIQTCLDQGKEAVVLVPEISLTPQMVERFKGRFGDDVAVLHSRLSNGERYDEWRKIVNRQVRVVIGARSAVFAPFTRLGLIIIDEEHESSYKQEESPKYHAREVAAARARMTGASVVLGSATPSLESWNEASRGHYKLLTMAERVQGRPLPPVHIVDMREELIGGNRSMFSRPLYQALEQRLERKEQSVLLLNRRGYSTFVMCRSCGYTVGCPHCEISLTFHQTSGMLRCHYCGYAERQPPTCPECQSEHIRYFGTGTQRVEEELAKLFPGIRVIRMDVDTTTEKGSLERLLNEFRLKKADVLLGTQMVAKGLDFPDVTLVGVITADTMLNLPDFRSSERTFQLLTQVAGRAGRHQLPGEVFVQTYTPDHYSVITASSHDYRAFVERELGHRRIGSYPPFCRLILITLAHEQQNLLIRTAEGLAKRLRELAAEKGLSSLEKGLTGSSSAPGMEVLGPVPSPIPRIKDRYRFQCMVKYRGEAAVSDLIGRAVEAFDDICRQEKLTISVDVDPQVLM